MSATTHDYTRRTWGTTMNTELKVEATIIENRFIRQEVTGPAVDWKTMARDVLSRQLADTKDAQFRSALIKLGWTPPKDEG